MKILKHYLSLILVVSLFFSPIASFADECEGQCGGGGIADLDGGGHELLTDDLALYINSLISFDNIEFFSASDPSLPAIIAEKKDTMVYIRTSVTNLADVSAINITLKHFFGQGFSDMVADPIQFLEGDVDYYAGTDSVFIPKIMAKKTVSFLYKLVIHELGQNDNLGTDGFTVESYKSSLPITNDGLNYVSIGEKSGSYFLASNKTSLSGMAGSAGATNGTSLTLPPRLVSVGSNSWIFLTGIFMSYIAFRLALRVHYRKKN